MPRYPHPEIPEFLALIIDAGGAKPINLYRVLANNPPMLDAWLKFAYALRFEARTPRKLRELMILRTAQLHRSRYEWQQHEPMARAAGVSEVEMVVLADWRFSNVFSEREQAALALTEAIVANSVPDAVHERAAALFSPAELIELTLTASFYCMVPRFLDAIDVNTEGEIDAEISGEIDRWRQRLETQHGPDVV